MQSVMKNRQKEFKKILIFLFLVTMIGANVSINKDVKLNNDTLSWDASQNDNKTLLPGNNHINFTKIYKYLLDNNIHYMLSSS